MTPTSDRPLPRTLLHRRRLAGLARQWRRAGFQVHVWRYLRRQTGDDTEALSQEFARLRYERMHGPTHGPPSPARRGP